MVYLCTLLRVLSADVVPCYVLIALSLLSCKVMTICRAMIVYQINSVILAF